MNAANPRERRLAGWLAAGVILALYGSLALTVDFPKTAGDIQSDEATYLLMGYSLAYDGDLEYRKGDLERAFQEWPNGPGGVFLKRGVDVQRFTLAGKFPFFAFDGRPDQNPDRLYYGKSFAYPLVAAPFVKVFGTNGFLVLNALLLVAAFLAAYTFLAARSSIPVALLLASSFIFASVIPVYFTWTTPELFNFSLGVLAFFLWLYKRVAPIAASPRTVWLRRPWTDALAGGVIGLLAFSKITNGLLIVAPLGWMLVHREWRRAGMTVGACVLVASAFFSANVAASGDWNYQGGTYGRWTCYADGPTSAVATEPPLKAYPFQTKDATPERVCQERGRTESLSDEIFDQLFWQNLRANLWYFFFGRYGGLFAYFFPGFFAIVALLAARGRRADWQWFVLGALFLQAGLFIVSLPYTWLGGGGSVGNRYFTGVYGLALFLLPPIQSVRLALVPWFVGALFMAKLVLNPFYSSIRPFEAAKSGPLRWFPVELTNANDLPIMNEAHRVLVKYGSGDPRFQIYHLDDNAFLPEADHVSFSVRGNSRAEMYIKADSFVSLDPFVVKPPQRLQVVLRAWNQPTQVRVEVGSESLEATLGAGQEVKLSLPLPSPFLFNLVQGQKRPMPALIWLFTVTTSGGFSPRMLDPASLDTRYLGVQVTPDLIR